jgi:hypothetical protein
MDGQSRHTFFSAPGTNEDMQLMGYGVPAAGVLCLELLQPICSSEARAHDPKTTHSSIIHVLNILVGFLDWLAPSASNTGVCNKAKLSIQQALDHVLSNGALGHGHGSGLQAWQAQSSGEMGEALTGWEQFNFHFDLMNTSDDWYNYDPEYDTTIHL